MPEGRRGRRSLVCPCIAQPRRRKTPAGELCTRTREVHCAASRIPSAPSHPSRNNIEFNLEIFARRSLSQISETGKGLDRFCSRRNGPYSVGHLSRIEARLVVRSARAAASQNNGRRGSGLQFSSGRNAESDCIARLRERSGIDELNRVAVALDTEFFPHRRKIDVV